MCSFIWVSSNRGATPSIQERRHRVPSTEEPCGHKVFCRSSSRRCAPAGGNAAVAPWRPSCTLRKEPPMATSHFQQFLHDTTTPEPDTDCPLGADRLYGPYMGWCLLQGVTPKPDASLRAGMRR